MRFRYLPVLATALFLFGCNKGVQTKEAVRQGVIDHLAKRQTVDLSQMQVEVSSVTFRGNEADALVAFRPKGSSEGGMEMRYTLEQQGNRWVVKGRSESGMPHGGAGQAPGAGAGGQMGGRMPEGHPPMGMPGEAGKKK